MSFIVKDYIRLVTDIFLYYCRGISFFFVTITGRHYENPSNIKPTEPASPHQQATTRGQRHNTIEIDNRQPLKNNFPEYGAKQKIRNIQDNVDEALVESRRSRPANDHTPGSKTRNDDRHNAGKQRSVRHLGAKQGTGRGYFFETQAEPRVVHTMNKQRRGVH